MYVPDAIMRMCLDCWVFICCFYSAPGLGKTHLLCAMTHAWLESGVKALYVIVPELLQFIRDGFDTEKSERVATLEDTAAQRVEFVRTAQVLVLDDLGAERSTEWAVEQLYRILDYRYREQLPTVIFSNLLPDMLPVHMLRLIDRM